MTTHKKLPKLDLNVTNRCNLRCKHCAFDSGLIKMKEMSLEEITELLVRTHELGGKKVDITGGEPTTRKDYLEIIKVAKSLDYKVELVTNSLLLNRQKLEHLKGVGLDGIAISRDGYCWETHHNIRGVSEKQFAKVLENISAAAEVGLYTKVNTVVFESNLEELVSIIQDSAKQGAQEVGLYYFTPVGRGEREGEKSIEPIKWLNYIRNELIRYKNLIEISLEIPLIENKLYQPGMGCIWELDPYHLQILPDGNAYPCAIMASYQKPIANLHQKRIKEVWESAKIWQDYRSILEEVFKEDDSCVNFPDFKIRDYQGYSFVCPLRKFSVEEVLL